MKHTATTRHADANDRILDVNQPRSSLLEHLQDLLQNPGKKLSEIGNFALARKPQFVVIGTGRSGTTYTAAYLTNAGVPVSHERYYTYNGPRLRHPLRDWRARGDCSWCAVPFLPDDDVVAIHQVRHPYKVISSFYNTGFFDAQHAGHRLPYVRLARQHFRFSDDPLQSCLRWYVEWNARCEAITPHRFRVEHFSDHIADIERWLGITLTDGGEATSKQTNARAPLVEVPVKDLRERLTVYPEFADLAVMAERYGYEL